MQHRDHHRGRTALQALGISLLLALAGTAQGQVWKCTEADGRTLFSDKPCAAAGSLVDERRLRGNAIAGPRVDWTPPPPEAQSAAAVAPAAANVCPSDRELREMETRASSTTMGEQELTFLRDELRRARQCRKGLGRYSAEDWAISRDAQAAQSNIKGAAEARRRAEDMHSAADPLEGERIARQRLQDTAAAERRQARELRPRPTPPAPNCLQFGTPAASVTNCR